MKTFAVILAGGKGERFWPASRRDSPKQFLKLFGAESLIRMTARRIAPLCPPANQRFVIDRKLGQVLKTQLKLTARNFIYEPFGRNTAPAIALAAAYLEQQAGDSVMIVLPADHLIRDKAGFRRDVKTAVELAKQGFLVTFGIPPKRPDTSYGYVEVGARMSAQARAAFKVKRFREKPDSKTARRFVRLGGFWWNSGMFVWKTSVLLDAAREFMPEFYAGLTRFKKLIGTRREWPALVRLYERVKPDSVDYAIMEKSPQVAVVRTSFDWDDVGSWLALERHFPVDRKGNVTIGRGVAVDAHGCMTMADDGLVALLGCKDLVVVRTADAVLVSSKKKAGDIKKLLALMTEHSELHEYL